jgi:hypothetical protein
MSDDNLRAYSERALVIVIMGTISLVAFLSFLGSSASEVGGAAFSSERLRSPPVVTDWQGRQRKTLMISDQSRKNPDQQNQASGQQADRETEIRKAAGKDMIDPNDRQYRRNTEYSGGS